MPKSAFQTLNINIFSSLGLGLYYILCQNNLFSQPAGYRGVSPPGAQVSLEQQAYMLLTEQERQTMTYYLLEYQQGHIHVEPLTMALFELFNTHAKVQEFVHDCSCSPCFLSTCPYLIFCSHFLFLSTAVHAV